MKDWLYEDGGWQKVAYYGQHIPVIGDFIRAYDTQRYLDDYMRNTGLTWADVRYPTRLFSAGYGGAIGGSVNFVSSNIKRLYK